MTNAIHPSADDPKTVVRFFMPCRSFAKLDLLFVFRFLFSRLYGLDPQGEVQQMADPHHGNADPADGRIFHVKKADGHNSGDHCDDLAFCSGCHGFFLNKAVQMLFVPWYTEWNTRRR